MDLAEYAKHDGLGLAGSVRERKVSVKELAALMLEGVSRVNPRINAVIETYPDTSETLDANEHHSGPFLGVPFLRKDIGATEQGRRQEMGSRLMKGYIAERDS